MKIGCDPEIFLVDAAASLVSSIGKIGGSKEQPRAIPELGEGFAVQEDNVAIEFNIPPAESADELVRSINAIKLKLQERINVMGLGFSKLSAAIFPLQELMHPSAMVFGCDPDYNAWNDGLVNPKPKADDHRLRSCGGHVHIGEKISGKKEGIQLIQLMDFYAGVPSVVLDEGELRKQLYGKAGAYRPKPYGVEYRTLSNFWIWDDALIKWIWNATQAAVDTWKKQDFSVIENEGSIIVDAINNNNRDAAMYLIDTYKLNQYYA